MSSTRVDLAKFGIKSGSEAKLNPPSSPRTLRPRPAKGSAAATPPSPPSRSRSQSPPPPTAPPPFNYQEPQKAKRKRASSAAAKKAKSEPTPGNPLFPTPSTLPRLAITHSSFRIPVCPSKCPSIGFFSSSIGPRSDDVGVRNGPSAGRTESVFLPLLSCHSLL